MQVIKITDYNFIELLEVDYKMENVVFRWVDKGERGRKYKARIRWKNGKPYFNSYNLSISLEGRI
jgi:hypothetical protein